MQGNSWNSSPTGTTTNIVTPGIGLHTPADVHYGLATAKAADRRTVLADARDRHPHRFGTTNTVPKILDLPDTVWINRPVQDATQETDTTAA